MMRSSLDRREPFAQLERAPAEIFCDIRTPAYIIDEKKLRLNCQKLSSVAKKTGSKILLAQKAFSNYDFYPILSDLLSGTEASGLYEARLGKERMDRGEVHVFSAAYSASEFRELLQYADHIIFNSAAQLKRFGPEAKREGKSLGIRINPQCSTQTGPSIYDPCAPGSRLGVTRQAWESEMDGPGTELLDGIHFHTLCEQNADALQVTLEAVDEDFHDILRRVKWVNFGGGHHITREDYDLEKLCRCIEFAQNRWGTEVYLEPGEAVALNAGFLTGRVLDIVRNGTLNIAILDVGAACHMPDVLEMPYTPPLFGASQIPDAAHPYRYRLAGPACLSGDIIGDYYLEEPLELDELLTFGDMAIYTTCKNNMFNGIPLPNIWSWTCDRTLRQITDFGYQDYVHRLGSL